MRHRNVKSLSWLVPLLVLSVVAAVVTASTSNAGIAAWLSEHYSGAELRVDASDVRINPHSGLRQYRGESFTGVAVRYFADGTIASEASFVDGRRHGSLRRWFPNGALAFEARYQRGKREGVTRSWWLNGNLRSRTLYVDDQPDGVVWQWYRSGAKFKRFQFAAGKPVGLQQGWRQNGTLFSNFEFRNGRPYGLRNANLCVELEDEAYVDPSDI